MEKPSPGWDAQRAKDVWDQMTPAQQQAQLAGNDRLIWAALNIRVDAAGRAVSTGQNWKVIGGG